MTEAEWLACEYPWSLFGHFGRMGSERKRILFCSACIRRVWDSVLEPRSRASIEIVEAFVDNCCTEVQMAEAADWAREAKHAMVYRANFPTNGRSRGADYLAEAAAHASIAVDFTTQLCRRARNVEPKGASAAASNVVRYLCADQIDPDGTGRSTPNTDEPRLAKQGEERVQSALFRDIFGNPFRPTTLNPSWLTSTVLALAQQMYDSRDFSPMPILADALQDAGCDNEDILNHCRQPGEHTRGCFVVDLLLGKT
jgi:hypothetical protein